MAYNVAPVPSECWPEMAGLGEFQTVAELKPGEIVSYFRAHAEAANRVLGQSYDERYSPSTFIEEAAGGYRGGWYDGGYQHVQRFADLPEACADYILFSFGKGRLAC